MKSKIDPQKGYAAAYLGGRKAYIAIWTVCGTAAGVREKMGKNWPRVGSVSEGWKKAREAGYRVVRVQVSATGKVT